MRLLYKNNLPSGGCEVKVSVASQEDLWHLYNFILPGDLVETNTKRKIKKETTNGATDTEKVTITLCIEVQEIQFSPDEIRVLGVNKKINEYVMLEQHHTLTIHADPPQKVTITKTEWDSISNERLKDACAHENNADTAVVLMDFGDARVFAMTPSYLYVKATVTTNISKKRRGDGSSRDKSISRFFKMLLDAMLSHVDFDKVKLVLFCSPGHVNEEFLDYCKTECQRYDQGPMYTMLTNMQKVAAVKVYSNSVGAVNEALKKPEVASKVTMTKCMEDMKVWELFQQTMNRNPDKCVYTPQYVYHAAMSGAIADLMVSDAVLRSPNPVERHFFLSLIQVVRGGRSSRISIFSSNHITGQNLSQLGNVAATLFFPCPELDDMECEPNFLESKEVAQFLIDNVAVKVAV